MKNVVKRYRRYAKEGDIKKVKEIVRKYGDFILQDDIAFRECARMGHIELLEYIIIRRNR